MPPFRAVLFDLDGTLIGLDMRTFLPAYLDRLGSWMAARGLDRDRFRDALLRASAAMLANDGRATNEAVFWQAFERLAGVSRTRVEPDLRRFYAEEFPRLRVLARPVEGAAEAVAAAFAAGCKVAIATNPVFPEVAIRERLRWAGLDGHPYHLVTAYERMHACKPNPAYFLEVVRYLGVEPGEALMVGNDPRTDLPAARAGLRTFLVEPGRRYGSGLDLAAASAGSPGAAPSAEEEPRPDFRGDLRDLSALLRRTG